MRHKDKITLWSAYIVAAIIALIPFHAFLTVWVSSGVGHYTEVRLWKEVLLLIPLAGAAIIGWRKGREWRQLDWLWYLIAVYALLQYFCGVYAYVTNYVSLKALAYGLLINLRFLGFFAVVWLIASRTEWLKQHWRQLVLIPAAIVVAFGLLQMAVLPHDFLGHFGYGPNTIPVTETVDQKVQYTRVASTTRGANPLGAYLVVLVGVLASLLAVSKKRWWYGLGLAATAIILFATFSRSAWLGAVVTAVVVAWLSLQSAQVRRWLAIGLAVLIVIGGGVTLALRHNDNFQTTVFHTNEHSRAASSNSGHASALRQGLKNMMHHPLGSGVGTAGPASVYNKYYSPRIAENYYVQIGEETGWLGMLLFVIINIRVAQLLWQRRTDGLALALFASFFGLVIVNMLSHAWADDTLAYLWWGLAGIALAPLIVKVKKASNVRRTAR